MQTVALLWARLLHLGILPRQGVQAVLPLGVALLACGVLAWNYRGTATSKEYLLEGRKFSDSQIAVMAQAFQKSKLTEYSIREGRIQVSSGQSHRFLAALAEREALPSDVQSHTDEALRQNRFLESDRDWQLRIRHAREKDLADQLRLMPGIENAMVQFDEGELDGFQRQKIVTACVTVLPAEGHVLDRGQIRTIRQMVAWTKAGLKPADVNVTDLRSGRSYVESGEEEAVWPMAEEYLRVKRSIEKEWQQKVESVVRFVPTAQVVVHVDLPEPSAEPTAADLTRWSEPQRIAVSVGIPESYLREIQRRQPDLVTDANLISPDALTDVSQQVQRRIESAVTALLPRNDVTQSSIAVTTFSDPPSSESAWEEWRRTNWPSLQSSHVLAGVVAWSTLLIVGPWWVRRRRAHRDHGPPTLRPFPEPSDRVTPERHLHPTPDEDAEELKLRATLADLVRQDPDRAAQVLHRWIERAG